MKTYKDITEKQFTKKQVEAINKLVSYLDELENKPRRLYSALIDFAEEFRVHDAIPSLKEAQNHMYIHLSQGEQYSELFSTLTKYRYEQYRYEANILKTEELSKKDYERLQDTVYHSIRGAEEFVKLHIKELADIIR